MSRVLATKLAFALALLSGCKQDMKSSESSSVGASANASVSLQATASVRACPTSPEGAGNFGGSFTCACPASYFGGIVWGTGTYTSDSDICSSALHAGKIGDQGGQVKYVMTGRKTAFSGTVSNGISSFSCGPYQNSFRFADINPPAPLIPTPAPAPAPAPTPTPSNVVVIPPPTPAPSPVPVAIPAPAPTVIPLQVPDGFKISEGQTLSVDNSSSGVTISLSRFGNLSISKDGLQVWKSKTDDLDCRGTCTAIFNRGTVQISADVQGNQYLGMAVNPNGTGRIRLYLQSPYIEVTSPSGAAIIWSPLVSQNTPMVVSPGFTLRDGQSLIVGHPVNGYKLTMQDNGNLVFFQNETSLWSTNTFGGCASGCRATMQEDGNFVIYSGSQAIFHTDTHNNPGAKLVLNPYSPDYFRIVKTSSPKDVELFSSGGVIRVGQNSTALKIPGFFMPGDVVQVGNSNWRTTLHLQYDGNLVMIQNGQVIYSSNTNRAQTPMYISGKTLVLGGVEIGRSPNLVNGLLLIPHAPFIKNLDGTPLVYDRDAATGAILGPDYTLVERGFVLSQGQSVRIGTGTNAVLAMQGDGNLVIVDNGVPVWASNTGWVYCNYGCFARFNQDGTFVLYNGHIPYFSPFVYNFSRTGFRFRASPPYMSEVY